MPARFDQKRRIRSLLISIILLTLPCYCFGIILLISAETIDGGNTSPTPSSSATITIPASQTPITPTSTWTAVPSQTETATWTASVTYTPFSTYTPTVTATPTDTPTFTATSTSTETLTSTPTDVVSYQYKGTIISILLFSTEIPK